MPKYIVEEKTTWSGTEINIRREPTATEAVSAGIALLIWANQSLTQKLAKNAIEGASRQLEKGDYDGTFQRAKQLMGMGDKEANIFGYYFAGRALEGEGHGSVALQAYTDAIDLAQTLNKLTNLSIILLYRGMSYLRQKQLSPALRDFTTYTELHLNEDTGYYYQALALCELGDLQQALENMTRAVKLNPGDAANYRERGRIYAAQNRTSQAIEDYGRALRLDPSDPITYSLRAAAYEIQGNLAQSRDDLLGMQQLSDKNINRLDANVHGKTHQLRQSGPVLSTIRYYCPLANTYWIETVVIPLINKYKLPDEVLEAWLYTRTPNARSDFWYTKYSGGLWATNKRLLCLGKGFFGQKIVVEYSYARIDLIELDTTNTEMHLKYEGKEIAFRGLKEIWGGRYTLVYDFIDLVKRKMASH